MYEGSRTTLVSTRGGYAHYFPAVEFGPNNPQGPLIDNVSGEEVDNLGIDWEVVDPASHTVSPLGPALSAQEQNEGSGSRSPGLYPHPEVVEPDRSLRTYYFFDDPTTASVPISHAMPRAGASQAHPSSPSPALLSPAWYATTSQASDDYNDLHHVLDLDFDDLRLGHQSNVIGPNSPPYTDVSTTLPVNHYDRPREEGPDYRWVRGPLR